MLLILPFVLAFQHVAPTTPASGDTTGYWQQRIEYRITARLDERAQVARASGELLYVNQSPDTLREMFFHQYLNAFRPGSRWSAVDEREGRVRFQNLDEPDYAYERFTSAPTVEGVPVQVEYPYAPDSTVARIALPRPLAPGDSVRVHFEWDARPSARVFRRQGRRGREYDFAQWYPKVAVYDREGWEENPLVPAGELYGEFGTYDVTLLLPDDQVVGATGVPVEGDPGWKRVNVGTGTAQGSERGGDVNLAATAYGEIARASDSTVLDGYRRVRFLAKGVHHFAWIVSPDFRYEGTLYRGKIPIHVLYSPGNESQWGNGRAVRMIVRSLQWLESIYGPYAYPQATGAQRLDGGATEFPMMVMYGPRISDGLVLHEMGHIYSYGFLANNEWRSGWMDEGLTSYQSEWAQNLTLPERARGQAPAVDVPAPGYRAHAATPAQLDRGAMGQFELDLLGVAQPIGTPAYEFSEFPVYNQMVYGRASMMYGALRDAIGDSAFTAFLQDYYARWQFKHVDELAMRSSAERAAGRDLGWFFEQWVHRTGLIDYALRDVRVQRAGDAWTTRARIERVGEYSHPMPVGVLTSSGWVIQRGSPLNDDQWVEVRTAERPRSVRLDPQRLTEDWDRRNDVLPFPSGREESVTRPVFDWPFLDKADRDKEIVAIGLLGWYTDPGGVTPSVRLRTNYQGWLDRWELGVAVPVRGPGSGSSGKGRLQGWITTENPNLPFASRPLVGVGAGAWLLDGVAKLRLDRTWDESQFHFANGQGRWLTLALTATLPYDTAWIDPLRWTDARVVDASAEFRWRGRSPSGMSARVYGVGGLVDPRGYNGPDTKSFGRIQAEASRVESFGSRDQHVAALRLFAGASDRAPVQRSIGLSSLGPTETFGNHLLRGRGAPFARSDVHYTVPGDAGLRGYSPLLRVRSAAAVNAQLSTALNSPRYRSSIPRVSLSVFADAAWATLDMPGANGQFFGDAGVGVSLRGSLYDQPITARVDVPLWTRHAEAGSDGTVNWVVSLRELF
ncbi:MAG TPA: M1 family metallopeptidase [Gemmatimonadaceae bacterium]|jgi:Aminopeptidase N